MSKLLFLIFTTLFLINNVPGQNGGYGSGKELDDLARKSESQRSIPESGLPAKITKISKADNSKLTPPKEDLDKYAQFLKQKRTGIIKLLQFNCNNRVVNVNDTKCIEAPQIVGNGSIYSFSAKSYVNLRSIDIRLNNNKFVGWHPLNYVLFSELGDVDLENFDWTKDVKALRYFTISKDLSQVAMEKAKFRLGVEIGGRLYKAEIPVKPDTTYLLYSAKYQVWKSNYDKTIIALKIIRKDLDGSVVLIWKEL